MKKSKLFLFLIALSLCTFSLFSQVTWLKVDCGTEFTVALKSDHTLWSWGFNANGQLGVGGTSNTNSTPLQIGTDTDWMDIAAGSFHAIAIKTDGTLWGWGENSLGQIGQGNTNQQNSPVQIGNDMDWKYITSGLGHSLAIKNDSSIWAWGYNQFGQLGLGSNADVLTPTQIGTDKDWISASAGGAHSLLLKSDNSIWVTGLNQTGQLGTSNNSDQNSLVILDSTYNWTEVSAGFEYSIARKTDGSIWSWGFNGNGQLGDGTTAQKDSPIQITNSTNWTSIHAGTAHTFAINSDQNLYGWGFSSQGQLGNGTSANTIVPEMIGFESDWISVSPAKGGSNGAAIFGTHSAGLRGDMKSICVTGSNYQGQLGNNSTNDLAYFSCETADLTLGMEDIAHQLSSIIVYPNPSNGIFTIENSEFESENVHYTITNLRGQIIAKGSLISANTNINLSDCSSGIYFLNFEKDGIKQSQKVSIR